MPKANQQIIEETFAEEGMVRVLASVGLQMTGFIHEVNRIILDAKAILAVVSGLREQAEPATENERILANLHATVVGLRQNLERQASYLANVISIDARRVRVPWVVKDRFAVAQLLLKTEMAKRRINLRNFIKDDIRTRPMLGSELTVVFANLLTNAIKATEDGGRIQATSQKLSGGGFTITVENTGVAVKATEGERWFGAFESTTTQVDPMLGQGMGLGLSITRWVLAENNAQIEFVEPSEGFSTALRLTFKP